MPGGKFTLSPDKPSEADRVMQLPLCGQDILFDAVEYFPENCRVFGGGCNC